jgi:hypothetical protein
MFHQDYAPFFGTDLLDHMNLMEGIGELARKQMDALSIESRRANGNFHKIHTFMRI